MTFSPLICHINLARGYRGGERQTELLVRELAARGYRQRVIARQGEPLFAALTDVPELDLVGIAQPFMPQVRHCKGVDVIQVHEAKGGHMACVAHTLYGTPYVITRRVDKPPSASFANRRLYRNAAGVVAVSQAIADILKGIFTNLTTSVIPDAHSDLPVSQPASEAIRARFAGKFLIGHAGALVDRHKGQLTLVEAMRQLAGSHADVQLVLLGEGEDESRIREAAADLTAVHLEGFRDDLGNYLHALDLFVYPSRFEGLGSVMLDAMQAGLPVVASRVGGIPEIVDHEQNGLLVEPGDAEGLAAAIARLKDDAQLYKMLSAAARTQADRYAPSAMADQYLGLYETLSV